MNELSNNIYQGYIAWNDCYIEVVTDDNHVLEVKFSQSCPTYSQAKAPLLQETLRQLSDYLAGTSSDFNLPLKLAGTTFQNSVWEQVQKVKPGTKITYKKLAEDIHHDRAVRAVGTALGRNKLVIIVPCHRVVHGSNAPTRYAFGPEIKLNLQALEAQYYL